MTSSSLVCLVFGGAGMVLYTCVINYALLFFQTHPKEVSVHLLNLQYPKQVFHRLLVRKIEYLKQVLDKI